MTTQPNPYTPNLSGITIGKPATLSGIGLFVSYTITLLTAFGLPLSAGQVDAIQEWVNQAEILVLPLITFFWMKRHFHETAVDLLHATPPPLPTQLVVPPEPVAEPPTLGGPVNQ